MLTFQRRLISHRPSLSHERYSYDSYAPEGIFFTDITCDSDLETDYFEFSNSDSKSSSKSCNSYSSLDCIIACELDCSNELYALNYSFATMHFFFYDIFSFSLPRSQIPSNDRPFVSIYTPLPCCTPPFQVPMYLRPSAKM